MEASNVYYTDFRCPVGTSLPEKLRRLCIAAGIKDIDMDGKFVAIKMHFRGAGQPGLTCGPTTPRPWPTCARSRGVCPF